MADLAQQIKARVLLSSVVKEAVSLKGRSPNFIGLCPFHEEKTPSFHVRDHVGRFKCFGCGAAGDAFEFLMRLRGISFNEAKAELAQTSGVRVGEGRRPQEKGPQIDPLLRAQNCAQDYFIHTLADPKQGLLARRYLLEKRGLSDAMIKQAGIGFLGVSKDAFFDHLRKHHVPEKVAIDAGLLKAGASLESPFQSRITFPIRDFKGRIIAFGARSFLPSDQGPKYINTHNYTLYAKRRDFYGLFESKAAILKGQAPLVVEGYFDAMALWALGLPALALCGTALSPDHVQRLARLSNKIIFCFDADNAGVGALKNSLALTFQNNLMGRAVILPNKKDPGDFLSLGQLDELRAMIENHTDALSFLISKAAVSAQGNIEARIHELDELLPVFASIKRPLIRRQYVMHLATSLHEDSRLLWSEVESRITSSKQKVVAPRAPVQQINLTNDEWLLLQICVAAPELLPKTLDILADASNDAKDIIKMVVGLIESVPSKDPLALEPWVMSRYPELWLKIKEVLANSWLFSPEEAKSTLLAVENKIEQRRLRAQMHKKRLEVQEFARIKDYPAMMQGLKETSALLLSSKRGNVPEVLANRPAVMSASKPQREIAEKVAVKKDSEFKQLSDETFFDPAEDWL